MNYNIISTIYKHLHVLFAFLNIQLTAQVVIDFKSNKIHDIVGASSDTGTCSLVGCSVFFSCLFLSMQIHYYIRCHKP